MIAASEQTLEPSNHFIGVGKAIEAYTLLLLTDHFGDIPYNEAFQGTDNLQPAFDNQQTIFDIIFRLIEDARQSLALDAGTIAPGSTDFFYGGDIANWNMFLNVLEARGTPASF